MTTEIIEAIKKVIGFRKIRRCASCAKCSRYEKDADAPVTYTCNYAGGIRFEVDEDDWCAEHEEI